MVTNNFRRIRDIIYGKNENYTWFYNIKNSNLIFSTYTFLQSDAREAIFDGTTKPSYVVYHPYTDSTSLNLAMCHYHAVVNGEQKPPHSFFCRTFSNSSSQPIC